MAHPGRPRKCDPKMESLFIHVEKKRNDLVKNILAQVGIDAADGEGRTALIHAAAYDNIELLKWLIKNGADVNFQDRIGYTALHFAAQNKWAEIAACLLENGANPDIQDIHGNSSLWRAIFESMDDKRVVKLLLKHGANQTFEINIIKALLNYLNPFIKSILPVQILSTSEN